MIIGMKKQTAIIVISAVVLVVGGLCIYLYQHYYGGSKKLEEATLSFDNGNVDDSINSLENKIGKSVDEELLLAVSYAQKGTLDFNEEVNASKALEIVSDVLAKDPNNAEAYRIQGYSYEIMRDYDRAVDSYDKSIQADPTSALVFSSRGHAYDLNGDEAKALTDYKTALQLDPSLDHANLNIARVYLRNGDNKSAVEHLNSVIQTSTNKAFLSSAEQLLGVIDMTSEKYDSAKNHFQSSINYDEKKSVAYVGKGEAIFAQYFQDLKAKPQLDPQEVYDSVFANVSKALEINKDQASAYMLAYELLVVSGDNDSAKQMLQMAESAVPNDITLGKLEKTSYLEYITSLKTNVK
jgi:tetratricopeptide (TPR) repeat protein